MVLLLLLLLRALATALGAGRRALGAGAGVMVLTYPGRAGRWCWCWRGTQGGLQVLVLAAAGQWALVLAWSRTQGGLGSPCLLKPAHCAPACEVSL